MNVILKRVGKLWYVYEWDVIVGWDFRDLGSSREVVVRRLEWNPQKWNGGDL